MVLLMCVVILIADAANSLRVWNLYLLKSVDKTINSNGRLFTDFLIKTI